jgi:hypothetical protein
MSNSTHERNISRKIYVPLPSDDENEANCDKHPWNGEVNGLEGARKTSLTVAPLMPTP